MESDFIALLKKHFPHSNTALLGIGDDAAVLPQSDTLQVISTDTLNQSLHFPHNSAPSQIATKSLLVNISDILAMGATPKSFFLNVSMPSYDQNWAQDFVTSLASTANKYQLQLLGGDTTQGTLSITITIIGIIDDHKVLRRSDAKIGEDIWVTGYLGAADYCYRNRLQAPAPLLDTYWRPLLPRQFIAKSRQLLSAATDISDGLLLDAENIANASQVQLQIDIATIPVQPQVIKIELDSGTALSQIQQQAAVGGEDYQILLSAAPQFRQQLQQIATETNTHLTKIGAVVKGCGITLQSHGLPLKLQYKGFQHFQN